MDKIKSWIVLWQHDKKITYFIMIELQYHFMQKDFLFYTAASLTISLSHLCSLYPLFPIARTLILPSVYFS